MQNFEFLNPTKVIFGKETIGKIGDEIRSRGHKKILLLAGKGSIKNNGVYKSVVSSLKNSGVEWIESWGIQANPVLSKVREMISQAKAKGVDALLAVGGGSVIDSGKVVAAGVYMNDVWDVFEDKGSIEKAMPIYTVLTISATGTEMNQYAVLTKEDEKKKWNISGPALYPQVSIIDPEVQMTLPWDQTVNGALDAISHIMEYYFMGGRSETTLALDESLCRTIISVTDELKSDPGDYDSRASLAWAATLALNGISGAGQQGGDWASHGIEHGISAVNPKVAHGAGLGVVFPAWIMYCCGEDPAIFKRWAKSIWGASNVAEGISAMKEKIKSWDGAVTLGDLGIEENQIKEIAANAFEFGLTGALKTLSENDIENILELAL